MGRRRKAETDAASTSASDRPRTSLADALLTTTQQRVLGFLFGQPERSFFATQLIALTRSGSGAVQRELKRLTESGLVSVHRVGNQKHYQANPQSPVFDELCGLVRKTVGLHDPIRRVLEPLQDRMAFAALYGSYAKRTDTATSDVDLLVVSDTLTLEDLYTALAPAEAQLARRINPTLYTQEEYERRRRSRNSLLTRVLSGEHLVLIGDDSAAQRARQSGSHRGAQG